MAAGGRYAGWVTAPRTFRDGQGTAEPSVFNICPILDWEDRQAGTYRMIRTYDDRHRRHGYEAGNPIEFGDTVSNVTATLPLPHLHQQAGEQPSPGRVLQQLAVRPVGCRSARPRVTPVPRASRIALPDSPGRGGTSRESRRPGARKRPRDPAPPRIHPITRGCVPAAAIAGQGAGAGVGMSGRHGRM